MTFQEPSTEILKKIEQVLEGYSELIGERKVVQEYAKDHQNVYFCYEKGRAIVMDNHRCAMWFWINKIDKQKKYSILHLDTHHDLAGLKYKTEITREKLDGFNLYDYLIYKDDPSDKYLYFNWANYVLPFVDRYNNNVENLFWMVNEDSDGRIRDDEVLKKVEISRGYDSLRALENIYDKDRNWIVNFDIDFFFKHGMQLYSDEYMDAILKRIKMICTLETSILTVALSPSCCGGWDNSIKVLEKMKNAGIL